MEQAIRKSIEGGWDASRMEWNGCEASITHDVYAIAFYDPEFWKCLGKAMGWGNSTKSYYQSLGKGNGKPIYSGELYEVASWLWNWHRFIDHLAEGKSVDDFFNELLNNTK